MSKIIQMQDRRQRRPAENRRQQRREKQPVSRGAKRVVEVENRVVYRPTVDYLIIVLLVGLIAFGLVMVYSSSYYVSEVNGESQAYYFLKQLLCVGIGTVALIFFARVDYHRYLAFNYDPKQKETVRYRRNPWYKRPYIWILAISIAMLLLVWTPLGMEVNGSRRWINIGFSIQPSEIVKIGLIIYIACSLGLEPKKIKSFGGLMEFIGILVLAGAIIILHPNLSAVACIVGLVFCLLIIGGAKGKHIGGLVAVAVALLVVLMIVEPYRLKRFLGVLDSDNVDSASKWQLQQSLYSIGAGGLFGRGLGNSMQKLLYLPYRESDFIFAIIAEETGLFGCLILLGMFALLIWRGVVTAMNAPDLTGMLIASGCTAALAIQVCVNIMVNIGLLPTTGVVLPFISYGGSAIVIFMAMIGLLLNVSMQTSLAVPVKKGMLPFVVPVPKEDTGKLRGLGSRQKRQHRYEIEQRRSGRRRRTR